MSELDGLPQIVGVPVKDYFGRDIGKVICYAHDGKGEVKSILATMTTGDIAEYSREDVQMSSSEVVLKDKLMTAAHALRKEIEINVKRMQALDMLKDSSKIHPRVYSELKEEFDKERCALEERKHGLTGIADERRIDVARKLMALEKTRATIEVQAISGEIDQTVYRYASSEVKSAIDRLTNELENLERELSFLDVKIEEMPKEVIPLPQAEELPAIEVTTDSSEGTAQAEIPEPNEGIIPGQPEEITVTQEPQSISADRPLRVRLV